MKLLLFFSSRTRNFGFKPNPFDRWLSIAFHRIHAITKQNRKPCWRAGQSWWRKTATIFEWENTWNIVNNSSYILKAIFHRKFQTLQYHPKTFFGESFDSSKPIQLRTTSSESKQGRSRYKTIIFKSNNLVIWKKSVQLVNTISEDEKTNNK